jgi:nicotinamide-nucleotide adenylyltransferase
MSGSERALYVGRFQPFHLGHLNAVTYVLSKASELVIVVGSAQYSHTLRNPFTAGERITMIRLALDDAKVERGRYLVIPIRDTHIHKMWVPQVVSQTPRFDIVYTNEPLTSRLFREDGYRVEPIPFYGRNLYSATEIRRRVIEGKDWKTLVPKVVYDYIHQIGGDERMRELAQTDKPNQPRS